MTEKREEFDTLRSKVVDIVRKMIVEGELKPGEKISERKISKQLGISTTPVKEAFRILQTEGLIYSVPRSGAFVSSLYKKSLLQLIFMRGAMEGTAAYFAATEATEDEIIRMEKCLEGALACIEGREEGSRTITEYNDEFHDILRRASRNEYLIGLIMNLRSIDKIVRTVANKENGEESLRAYREHRDILDAVKSGRAERAEELMVSHIRRVAIYVLDKENEE